MKRYAVWFGEQLITVNLTPMQYATWVQLIVYRYKIPTA